MILERIVVLFNKQIVSFPEQNSTKTVKKCVLHSIMEYRRTGWLETCWVNWDRILFKRYTKVLFQLGYLVSAIPKKISKIHAVFSLFVSLSTLSHVD